MSAPDTSAEAVERVAQLLDEVAEPLRWDCATRNEAAALLRALVAGRDHWKATFHARYVEDVRDTKDAYARGWREGAEKMREGAAKAATTASRSGVNLCPYGRDRPGDPTWNHTEDDLCPVCRKNGDESLHFCTDSVGGNIAAAIRALPLPEPQA